MTWQRLGESGIHTARYGFADGQSRTVVVECSTGQFIVYSPGKELLASAREIVPQGADVVLVAPSGGHTLGVGAWAEEFSARVVAAKAAVERIQRKSSVKHVENVEALEDWLPPHVQVHLPPRSRTGEVWLSVEHGETIYWLVCDSIMNIAALSERWYIRWLQRLYGLGTGLTVGRIFRLGTRDRPGFRRWVRARLSSGRKNVLVPCHGEVDQGPRLGERLIELVDSRF